MHSQLNAQECARKVHFYKSCASAASGSEFAHAKRILRLKSRRASWYSVKAIKMLRLAIDPFLILRLLHGLLRRCETDCTAFLFLHTQDVEKGQLRRTQNLRFLAAPICSCDGVWNFVFAFERNHANTSILLFFLSTEPSYLTDLLRLRLVVAIGCSEWLKPARLAQWKQ